MDIVLMTLGNTIDKTFYGFDTAIFEFFGKMQCSFLTFVAKIFTSFGDEAFVIPMIILGVLMLFKKTRKYGITLFFAIIIGTLITNVIVKPMALRIRPYNTLQGNADYWKWYIGAGALSESDYSFPSGHTTVHNGQPCVSDGALCNRRALRYDRRHICRHCCVFPDEALYEAD